MSVFIDDPTPRDEDVPGAGLDQKILNPGKEGHVGPGKDRHGHHVHVFLDRRVHDHLGGLVEPGVDDLETGIPKGGGDDLGPPVVSVEPGFGHQDPDFPISLRHAMTPILRVGRTGLEDRGEFTGRWESRSMYAGRAATSGRRSTG